MSTADNIIELRRVSKAFRTGRNVQRVLDQVDLAIERGKTTVIIGPSGTGKSVLLKNIVGLLRPDSGEVWYEGERIDQLSERRLAPIRQQISFVFQLNALFDSMTVGQNVAFPIIEGGSRMSRAQLAQRVSTCLDQVGLTGFEQKRPADLSGGEKKRVALARAIANEPPPRVILYDEPTAGLDPQRSDIINKLIRALQRTAGVTSVVVTHDMRSAQEVADRILMLSEGRFIVDVPTADLGKVQDPRVRRFVDGAAEPAELAKLHV